MLALEAIFAPKGTAWRLPVIFAFGLLHGLGFGSVMKVYLENADLSAGLIGITIGVELGHLAVLVATGLAVFAVQLALKSANKPNLYRPAFVIPVAVLIALVGTYWALQRVVTCIRFFRPRAAWVTAFCEALRFRGPRAALESDGHEP